MATTVVSITLAGIGGLFLATRNFISQQCLRIETTQALRATIDNLARDLRLGGACLPTNGDFLALDGTNNGTTDTILTRTGMVQPNLTCVRTATSQDMLASDGVVPVGSTDGFKVGMGAYIRHPNGTGETFVITGIDTGNKTLGEDRTLSQDYPSTSGVYAADERTYAIDTSNPNLPVLTIARNGQTPVPFAFGIESLNVQYKLERNCPPCDTVDLPMNDAEWSLVKEIIINVAARSQQKQTNGTYYRQSAQVNAKPRNLLPG